MQLLLTDIAPVCPDVACTAQLVGVNVTWCGMHGAGTRGAMDVIEIPSHFMENFVNDARTLPLFLAPSSKGSATKQAEAMAKQLRQDRHMFGALDLETQASCVFLFFGGLSQRSLSLAGFCSCPRVPHAEVVLSNILTRTAFAVAATPAFVYCSTPPYMTLASMCHEAK